MQALRVGLILVAVAAAFVVWYAFGAGPAEPPLSDAPVPRLDASVASRDGPQPEVAAESALVRQGAVAASPGTVQAGELAGLHEKSLDSVNRVLKQAGRPVLRPDTRLTPADIEILVGMVAECNAAIDRAADDVLDYQAPFARKMTESILEAAERGGKPPFDVLPDGRLPQRGPYDLLVTTSHRGVVYCMKLPVDQQLMEVVDKQRGAEMLRLEAFTEFASRLR